ncbi:MAG: hypothetical protein IH820_13480, partial [Bacteroidetes bacterium]|nr:hypothetical protein [Bacteroidota bacterium]
MFLLARHSSLVLIFQLALFWTSVEGIAQSKSAMNHTEHTAAPFSLPAQTGLTIGTLDIVDSGTLTDLELAITFEGSRTASLNYLRFTLISPIGTPVILTSGGNTGTGSGNVQGQTLFGTILDDEAITSINAGVPPYIGPHQPHASLSAFDGESITGYVDLIGTNSNGESLDAAGNRFIMSGPLFVWLNGGGGNNWATLRLKGRMGEDGTGSNADAIGARVFIESEGFDGESVTQVQDVLGSSSFLSMSSLALNF